MAHEARSERARLSPKARRSVAAADARSATRSLTGIFFAVPPLALVAAALLLAFRGGGIVPEQWTPVAVGAGVAFAVLAALGSVPLVPRCAWPPLVAFAGFVSWSALSLTWSEAPEATAETVARLSLLLLAAIFGASYAARPALARSVAAALALGGAILVVAVEVKVFIGSTSAFVATRLAWPIDYPNGDAALLLLPLPALLAGAAAEQIRPLGRALAAAAAALALAAGLMTLSRGAAIAVVAALVVCIALAVERSRLALTIAAVVMPVAALGTRLTAGTPGQLASDAASRGRAAGISAAAAVALVFALASFERLRPTAFRRGKAPAAIAVWVSVVAVGAGVFLAHDGRPDTWVTARWHEFGDLESPRPGNVARFGNASSNRYDYWRVAGGTFEDHPLNGVGAGAFGVPWFRDRAITESVTDAHSWGVGALAETGVVGLLLLGAALLFPLAQVARARRELGGFASIALGGAVAYFVLHGSADWLFLIPAVAVPAFVALGACASAGRLPELRLAPGKQRVVLALGALFATATAIPIYLSTTLTARAETQAGTSTRQALDTIALAARANPWAVQPNIVQSQILLEAGRTREAIQAAKQATERGPQLLIAWRNLADAERVAGHGAASAAALRRAVALNPLSKQARP
jgi:O-antigen ligase